MATVRVGLVGCGGFQRYRVGNLLKIPEAQVVALADPDADQIARMRGAHPQVADSPSYSTLEEMLEKSQLDALLIATPHTQHAEQILQGIERGKHVLSEKPLVTSTSDAHRVIQARDKAGVVGMVSYQRHFQAEFRYIRERIRSGEVGGVTYVQALLCQEWKRATKGTWRQIPELSGGGQLNDSGSHLVDILLWTTGLEADQVSAVMDYRGTPVDINSSLSIRFKNGALGSITIIGDAPRWHEDITICTEEESYFLRQGQGLTIHREAGGTFKAENLPGGTTPDQNFIDAVLGRAECECPFECGLEVIRLTEAAWQSDAAGGAAIKVSA